MPWLALVYFYYVFFQKGERIEYEKKMEDNSVLVLSEQQQKKRRNIFVNCLDCLDCLRVYTIIWYEYFTYKCRDDIGSFPQYLTKLHYITYYSANYNTDFSLLLTQLVNKYGFSIQLILTSQKYLLFSAMSVAKVRPLNVRCIRN